MRRELRPDSWAPVFRQRAKIAALGVSRLGLPKRRASFQPSTSGLRLPGSSRMTRASGWRVRRLWQRCVQVGFDIVVGRVDKDQLGALAAGGAGIQIAGDGVDRALREFTAFEHGLLVLLHTGERLPIDLVERGFDCAAAEGFEAVGAGAGEEIGHAAAFDAGAEAGKDRLAHPIRGGTCGVALGGLDLNAAGVAACDAHNES